MYRIKLADGSEIKVKYEDVFSKETEDGETDGSKKIEDNKSTEENEITEADKKSLESLESLFGIN